MRRFSPAALALIVVLGVGPAALLGEDPPQCNSLPECFDFSLTASGGVEIAGYFTYSTPPADDVYLVTGFEGWFSDPNGQYNVGPPITYTAVTDGNTILWPDVLYPPAGPGIFSYGEDNLFYSNLSSATGTEFDRYGVILYATNPVYDLIRIEGTYVNEPGVTNDGGPAGQDLVAVVFENGVTLTSLTDYFTIEGSPGTGVSLVQEGYQPENITDLPESGSMWMVGLCAMGLAGSLCFKIWQPRALKS